MLYPFSAHSYSCIFFTVQHADVCSQEPKRICKEISVPGTCCCQPIEDNLRHMRYSTLSLRTLRKSMCYGCTIFLRADPAIKQHNCIAPGTAPGKPIQRTAHTESSHWHRYLVQLIRILFCSRSNWRIIQYRHGQAREQNTCWSSADFICAIPETTCTQQHYSLLILKHLPELTRRAINTMPQCQYSTCFQQWFDCAIGASQSSIRSEKHDKLTIQHGSKLHNSVIQVALILWHIGFWNIVGQVEQRLLMMFSDNGESRTYIGFETEAPAVKGKIVVHG